MITRRIKFIESVTLADGTTFEAGRVYELPGPSAQRWIIRNKAEETTEDPWAIPEKEPEAAAAPVSFEDEPTKPPAPPVNKATTKAPKKKLKKKSAKK